MVVDWRHLLKPIHFCDFTLKRSFFFPKAMANATNADLDQLNEKLRENCCNGHSPEVLKCIESGASVNSRNKVNGWTALHWAAKRGHDNIVLILLKHGANPNVQNMKGELPVDVTTREDIKRLLSLEVRGETDGNLSDRLSKEEGSEQEQKEESNRTGKTGKVSFVPGYLANPVFPYAVATGNPILTQAVAPSSTNTGDKEPPVLFPGYLAKPVIMTASSKPFAEDSDDGPTNEQKVETPVLVPGYLANPMIPYAMATGGSISGGDESKAAHLMVMKSQLTLSQVTSWKQIKMMYQMISNKYLCLMFSS